MRDGVPRSVLEAEAGDEQWQSGGRSNLVAVVEVWSGKGRRGANHLPTIPPHGRHLNEPCAPHSHRPNETSASSA